jgi:hypothetical protein
VVKAAKMALEKGNVNYALIWVPEGAENEAREAFEKTMRARKQGKDAKEVADDWFFETVIRLHRAGEGAPYTGLKPAGLDEGPVVPRAEKAIETSDSREVTGFLLETIEDELRERFNRVIVAKNYKVDDVEAGRKFVHAFIGFVVWSHHLHKFVKSGEGGHEEGAGHAD